MSILVENVKKPKEFEKFEEVRLSCSKDNHAKKVRLCGSMGHHKSADRQSTYSI